jgi:hypothetical protein
VKNLLLALAIVLASVSPVWAQSPVFGGDIAGILHQTAAACPRAWSKAHAEGDPERYDFIIEAVKRLYEASGGSVGGNWRRGDVGDLSMDGITVLASDGRYYFADVIGGAGGNNPTIGFRFDPANLLRDRAGNYAPHGFVKASDLPRPAVACGTAPNPNPGPTPNPNPAPTPQPPAVDLGPLVSKLAALEAAINAMQGNLLGRAQILAAIQEFQSQLVGIQLDLVDVRAQNRMLIGILNDINAKLSEPLVLKGTLLGMPVTLRKQ